MKDNLREIIINYWNDTLRKVDATAIANVNISVQTKEYLANVGVPDLDNLSIEIFIDPSQYEALIYENIGYHIIGDNVGANICVKDGTNEIYWVDEGSPIPIRFINSSLENLIGFSAMYFIEGSKGEDMSYEEAKAAVNKLTHAYNQIDPLALADPENWWSVILEQVDYGM